jgi:hypothetical protein
VFVLDEAVEMLSHGFKDQIYDIFQLLPPKLQVGLNCVILSPLGRSSHGLLAAGWCVLRHSAP